MLSKFVPPAGPPRVLAIAQLTNSVGDGAYYVCSALYFTRVIGLSPTQVGFALAAVSFLASAGVLLRLPSVPGVDHVQGEPALAVLRDRPYALVSFLNMIMLLYMPMLSLILPLWIVQHTHAPRWMVAALLVLNTVAVVLFQVRVARRVTGLASAAILVRYAGVFLL